MRSLGDEPSSTLTSVETKQGIETRKITKFVDVYCNRKIFRYTESSVCK